MTDKTPKKTAENLVNSQAASEKTTNTARDSQFKSRALPQADALKARFKAGSIPLQTDFTDLIDLANMGRLAVGGAEGQTGPADGFILSSIGRLELKSSAGITVDDSGVGLKLKNDDILYKNSAPLELCEDGKFLGIDMGTAIESLSNGISVKAGDGIHLAHDRVCVMDGDGISVNSNGVNVKPGDGLQVDSKGVNVKPGDGLHVNSNGVYVKGGDGISVTYDNVNVKPGKGIYVDSNGVNVKPGDGLHVNSNGVYVKGGDGISVTYDNVNVMPGKGINVDFNGVNVKPGKGIYVDSNGVSIKLATDSGLSADGANGLGLNSDIWIRMLSGLHRADFYAKNDDIALFFCNSGDGCVAYVYGRGGSVLSGVLEDDRTGCFLDLVEADRAGIEWGTDNSLAKAIFVAKELSWSSTKASAGIKFNGTLLDLLNNKRNVDVILQPVLW